MAPSKQTNANGLSSLGLVSSSSTLPPVSAIPPSVYLTDTIKDVAESLGVTTLKDSVAAALAADVEYRIREMVQDAAKFMRHSKRDQLRTTDIDAALRARNVEPLYGFMPSHSARNTAGPKFRKVQTTSGVPLHYVEDDEIDFDKVLQAGPRVGVGKGVGWGAHWLAIEGVQPALPQNPSPAELAEAVGPVGFSGPATLAAAPPTAKAVAVAGRDGQAVAKPLVKHILSRELQLYYERLTKAIVSPPPEADEDLVQEDEAPSSPVTPPRPGTQLKSFASKGSGNHVRDAALASLRGDPGLHQLVPYLIQFVGTKVTELLRPQAELDAHMLQILLSTLHALLANPHVFVEPYLHQMMPSLLSVLLSGAHDEYALRAYAAALVAHIVDKHGAGYPTLQPRLVSTLLKATADDRLPGTKLGAVMGLRKLGRNSFASLLRGDTPPVRALAEWIAQHPQQSESISLELSAALQDSLPPFVPPEVRPDGEQVAARFGPHLSNDTDVLALWLSMR